MSVLLPLMFHGALSLPSSACEPEHKCLQDLLHKCLLYIQSIKHKKESDDVHLILLERLYVKMFLRV